MLLECGARGGNRDMRLAGIIDWNEDDMGNFKDYMVRCTAADNQIRAFGVTARDMVEEARRRHDTSPVATVALGRLLVGGSMMGAMMKGDKDLLTVQIKCEGPIGGLTVTADANGHVKGYVANPQVMLPLDANHHLDVAGALGLGVLSVIKDIGLREPYVGDTILVTSEIGDDLTYYFATSEQVPSSVGLGVLMDRDNTVSQAGGFIIQLMPGAQEGLAERLEDKVRSISSITEMLGRDYTPEMILGEILGDFGLQVLDTMPVGFACNCSKERMSRALVSIGREELGKIISDGEPIEMNCHFCGDHYTFTIDELRQILAMAEGAGR